MIEILSVDLIDKEDPCNFIAEPAVRIECEKDGDVFESYFISQKNGPENLDFAFDQVRGFNRGFLENKFNSTEQDILVTIAATHLASKDYKDFDEFLKQSKK